jgi:hypothetical protein
MEMIKILKGDVYSLEEFSIDEFNNLRIGDLVATTFHIPDTKEILIGKIKKFNYNAGTVDLDCFDGYDMPYDALRKYPNIKYKK